jgi:hypothetical protein
VSSTSDAHSARFTHYALNRRTVAEIQERIVEKGTRNLLSRLVHAKNDKETLASWKLDLNRILHVFTVRFSQFRSAVANHHLLDRAGY